MIYDFALFNTHIANTILLNKKKKKSDIYKSNAEQIGNFVL